jgi:hypothetical protein
MIVIIEGPPGSQTDKTAQLVNQILSKSNDTSTFTHTKYKDLNDNEKAKLYFSSMTAALTYDKNVVLDRSWQFTDLPAMYKRMLNRTALSRNGIVIKCLPSMDSCIDNTDMPFDDIVKEYRKYMVAFEKYNDMSSFYYDHENDTLELLRFNINKHKSDNPYKGGGHFKRGNVLVLCSKWRVTKDVRKGAVVVPYVNFNEIPGSTKSASALITETFETSGIPEKDIYWVNVESTAGVPLDTKIIEDMEPRRVVAIGTQPRLWAISNNVNAEFYTQPNRTDTTLNLF